MIDQVYEDLKASFQKTYDALARDLARIRSGRANSNLLDGLRVSYYGQSTPLNQVAAVAVPEARVITIKPWEAPLLKEIERAILQSDLGLTPNNDGVLIRLVVPPLTEERRKALAKQVSKDGETAKVAARNARRDVNNQLKEIEKGGDITEDQLNRALKKVQEMTDEAISHVEKMLKAKENEIMEI